MGPWHNPSYNPHELSLTPKLTPPPRPPQPLPSVQPPFHPAAAGDHGSTDWISRHPHCSLLDVEEDQQVGRHRQCNPGTVVWPGGMGCVC